MSHRLGDALGRTLDEDGRATLRIAAGTTTRTELRIALQRAAGARDEGELDEVLETADREGHEAG